MKTLIIHHLEPTWENSYRKFGTSFEELCEKVAAHVEVESYDKVILTQFEHTELDSHFEYAPLFGKIDFQVEYGYGWDAEMFASGCNGFPDGETTEQVKEAIDETGFYKDPFGNTIVQGGSHSEVVLVDHWMQTLPKTGVDVCGAFENECINDLEIALNFMKVDFNRVSNLIVG